MDKIFVLLLAAAFLTACGPAKYSVNVEKKIPASFQVSFSGTIPAVIELMEEDRDSLYIGHLATGVAERLEAELGFDAGTVPIYTMQKREIDTEDSCMIDYLYDYTGSDRLVVIDSMKVGEFRVLNKKEKAYYGDRFLCNTIVVLPYVFTLKVFQNGEDPAPAVYKADEKVEWTLLGESPLPEVTAIGKVQPRQEETFRSIGSSAISGFFPRWSEERREIYVYENQRWIEAYELAASFEWEKAMKIWLKDADSGNTTRAAAASHNISTACEILGMKDLADEWKQKSIKLFNRLP